MPNRPLDDDEEEEELQDSRCRDLVRQAEADPEGVRILVRVLKEKRPSPEIHDALCRATIKTPWDPTRDPEELALASRRSAEDVAREQREAMRGLSMFTGDRRCPVCDARGSYDYPLQLRSADEPMTLVRRCENGHETRHNS